MIPAPESEAFLPPSPGLTRSRGSSRRPRRSRRRPPPTSGRTRWLRRALATAWLLVTATLVAPSLLLDVGRAKARACLRRIVEPRDSVLPDCERLDRWLRVPARVPWTARAAQLLREELDARMAVARYVDAAVGTPDHARLAEGREEVLRATERVEAGTGVLRMSELGPLMPAPDLAELAFAMGDGEGLDEHAFEWTQWYASVHTIEAALLRGDLPRAQRLAEHYAGRPDHELRLLVGALLCSGDDPHRGLDEVVSVERSRAEKRTANFWRNFGPARVLVEACAARAGVAAPSVPPYGGAGEWDHRDRALVMRARLAKRAAPCATDDPWCAPYGGLGEAASSILDRLESGGPLAYRAELVGAIATSVRDTDLLAALARTRAGEPDPASRTPLTLLRLAQRTRSDQPFLATDELIEAADDLLGRVPTSPSLRATAGFLLASAAATAAGRGDAPHALAWARRAVPYLFVEHAAQGALFESSVAYLAGESQLAREGLARAVESAAPASPVAAAAVLQLAEVDAASGQLRRALGEARRSIELAREAGHAGLEERGRWTVAALEALTEPPCRGPRCQAPAVGPPEVAAVGSSLVPAASLRVAAERALEPMGTPGRDVSDDVRRGLVDRALGTWQVWLRAGPTERRAHRYQAISARPDAPEALVAFLVLAGQLVDQPSEVESWLAAFSAVDARRLRLRARAWAHLEAARWRGDEDSARRWLARYRTLEQLATDARNAELLQEAGM